MNEKRLRDLAPRVRKCVMCGAYGPNSVVKRLPGRRGTACANRIRCSKRQAMNVVLARKDHGSNIGREG